MYSSTLDPSTALPETVISNKDPLHSKEGERLATLEQALVELQAKDAVLYTPPPFLAESARTPSNPRTVRRVQADSEQSPNNLCVVRGQSEDSPSTTTKTALVDFARTPLGLFGLSSDSARTFLGLCSDFAQTRTLQTVKLAI